MKALVWVGALALLLATWCRRHPANCACPDTGDGEHEWAIERDGVDLYGRCAACGCRSQGWPGVFVQHW